MLARLSRLWNIQRRCPVPTFQVGDLVRYRGRAMAIAQTLGSDAQLIWFDEAQQLHTAGFVPLRKLKATL